MSDASVRLTRADGVAWIEIDNPAARNAISFAVADLLDEAVTDLADGEDRVVVLTGAGDKAFVSGGDLKELRGVTSLDDTNRWIRRMRGLFDRLAGLPVPVIAALNGDAYGGGCETAIACDVRVAASGIRLGLNQVSLAIPPGWGGMERLVGLVGRGRAMHLVTTGRIVDADEAARIGLVEEVLPADGFHDRVREVATGIAAAPRAVLMAVKETISMVAPPAHPRVADRAVDLFAPTWVASAHWDALDAADAARRARAARS